MCPETFEYIVIYFSLFHYTSLRLISIRSGGKRRLRRRRNGTVSALNHSSLVQSESLELGSAFPERPKSQADVIRAFGVEDAGRHGVGGLRADVVDYASQTLLANQPFPSCKHGGVAELGLKWK